MALKFNPLLGISGAASNLSQMMRQDRLAREQQAQRQAEIEAQRQFQLDLMRQRENIAQENWLKRQGPVVSPAQDFVPPTPALPGVSPQLGLSDMMIPAQAQRDELRLGQMPAAQQGQWLIDEGIVAPPPPRPVEPTPQAWSFTYPECATDGLGGTTVDGLDLDAYTSLTNKFYGNRIKDDTPPIVKTPTDQTAKAGAAAHFGTVNKGIGGYNAMGSGGLSLRATDFAGLDPQSVDQLITTGSGLYTMMLKSGMTDAQANEAAWDMMMEDEYSHLFPSADLEKFEGLGMGWDRVDSDGNLVDDKGFWGKAEKSTPEQAAKKIKDLIEKAPNDNLTYMAVLGALTDPEESGGLGMSKDDALALLPKLDGFDIDGYKPAGGMSVDGPPDEFISEFKKVYGNPDKVIMEDGQWWAYKGDTRVPYIAE